MGKLIDSDALTKALGITDMNCERCAWYSGIEWNPCKRGSDFEQACFAIENAPEAVGRCKDCKWYNGRERTCNDLMSFGRYWKPDDFCSYWKRRTDETD